MDFYPAPTAAMPALPPVASGAPTLDTLHTCDALQLLKALPDASIDAIIADPPYDSTELEWDNGIDWKEFWSEARRVLSRKNSPVILFSQQTFTTDLIVSNRKGWRRELIWHKTMPVGFLDANVAELRCHENIQIFADARPYYCPQMETGGIVRFHSRRESASHYGKMRTSSWNDDGSRYPRSVWTFAQRNTSFGETVSLHPTAKPLPLMERLIMTYTQPGEVVLDPFAGSGSTLLAARNNGRRYIGCDLSRQYVTEARERLAQPYNIPMFNLPAKQPDMVQGQMFAAQPIG